MYFIIIFVILLLGWALHLLQQAIERQEFSLILACCMVASSAVALMGVYFLMGNYVGYLSGLPHSSSLADASSQSMIWVEYYK